MSNYEDYDHYVARTGRRDWQFPPVWHRHVAMEMGMALYQAMDRNEVGETLPSVGVQLSPTAFFIPDIIFVRAERRDIVGEEYVDGAPDLVIEVPAPATPSGALLLKRALYLHYAVPEYWFVDVGAERIDVLIHRGDHVEARCHSEDVLRSEVLPTFQVNLSTLFADPWRLPAQSSRPIGKMQADSWPLTTPSTTG